MVLYLAWWWLYTAETFRWFVHR